MKKILAITLLLFAGCFAKAQNYPSEWVKYTSDGYFHDIESAQYKQAVNGRSSVYYNSQKSFSTDVDMDLAQTLSHYNDNLGKYYVIAYINKGEACNYYENQIKMLISNASNYITIADNYINTGFKNKAKEELQKATSLRAVGSRIGTTALQTAFTTILGSALFSISYTMA